MRVLEKSRKAFFQSLRRAVQQGRVKDPKSLRESILKDVYAALPVTAGRPRKGTVTHAYRLRKKGEPWPKVYLACIDQGLPGVERVAAQVRLRKAVRQRKVRGEPKANKIPGDCTANKFEAISLS